MEKQLSEINPLIPSDWSNTLKDYIGTVKIKKGEHDKRAYFKSVIMEQVFKIDPKDIEYESKRNDLFYAGVLFETKSIINEIKRNEGLDELKRYLQKRSNVKLCVLTDCLHFELYDPSNLQRVKEFDVDKLKLEEKQEDYERRVFNELYSILYPDLTNLAPEPQIIVPRLKHLIDKWVAGITLERNDIKYVAWKSYVSKAFGSEDDATPTLFKTHALLYYTTVILTARAIGYADRIDEIIEGLPFVADGIKNYVEGDSFFDFLDHNHGFFKALDEEIKRYNFKEGIANDVFLMLYEDLISPSERHSLGEFYTPKWLAEILVEKAVDKDDVVLDPACGSGTFLRCAIERKKKLGKVPNDIYKETLGFDINPIAVAIAKANYLITMKLIGVTPEIMPVFLSDSLMPLEKAVMENTNITEFNSEGLTEIMIDFNEIVEDAGRVPFKYRKDWGIREITKYLEELSKGKDEGNLNDEILKKVKALERQGKNHVWFYILRNIYTPYYYREKVDVVIGNPPWLTYKDVKNAQRQKFLDDLYRQYEMKAGAENKTQQDMAGFFLARCKEYLKQDGKIAFVLTRAIFNGAQYNGLRRGQWNLEYLQDKETTLWFAYIWDVEANPFRKPSCMVLLSKAKKTQKEIHGEIIGPKQKVDIRKEFVPRMTPCTFYINLTQHYSAISTTRVSYQHASIYYKDFKQGATIVPRSHFFVVVEEEKTHGAKVSTDPSYVTQGNKRRRKGGYGFSFDENWVPKNLLYTVILGEDIEPFRCNLTRKALLPIENGRCIFNQDAKDKSYVFSLKDEYKNKELYKRYEELFNDMEKDWEAHRGEKFSSTKNAKPSSRMSVFERLNKYNELLAQTDKQGYLVVYNASGQDIRSAVVENPDKVVVEHKVYYSYFEDKEEAYYICGVLNSKYLLDLLKSSGILSERDIMKKPLDIPIPEYDKNNETHVKISELSMKITEAVKQNTMKEKFKNDLEELVKVLLAS